MQELEPLHIYSKYAVWSSYESPKKWGVGAVWVSVPCHCIHFTLPGFPGQTSVGEDVLSAVGTRCPKMGWYSKGASASLKRREGRSGGERFVIVGLGGEEGGNQLFLSQQLSVANSSSAKGGFSSHLSSTCCHSSVSSCVQLVFSMWKALFPCSYPAPLALSALPSTMIPESLEEDV